MRNLNLIVPLTLSLMIISTVATAQMYGQGYVEYGYSIFNYDSDQLKVFMTSYNNDRQPSVPFDLKVPAAKGDYLKFGVGFGSTVGMVLDFAIYKMRSQPMSSRFSDGAGRDIWYDVRNSNTNVGIRFGGTKEIPVWGQVNIDCMVQSITLYSAWVFPDGSRSLGRDHAMNGVFDDFNLIFGLGASVGCRIIGPLALTAAVDYTGRGIDSKAHPEYHQYGDNNDVDNESNYIPQDVAAYYNQAPATENSIYNDFGGFRFSAGVILMLASDMK